MSLFNKVELTLYSYEPSLSKRNMTINSFVNSNQFAINKGDKVVIGIDQSHTGYALTIMSLRGQPLYSLVIHGKGTYIDDFVEIQKSVLLRIIDITRECLVRIGHEQVIVSKDYVPMVQLNEIRTINKMIIDGALGRGTLEEINNWAWKAHVLPPDLRRKELKKGSVKYVHDFLHISIQDDNITDSICIAKYLLETIPDSRRIIKPNVTRIVDSVTADYVLCDNLELKVAAPNFEYDQDYNLATNVDAISLAFPNIRMIAEVPLRCLSFNDIANSTTLSDKNKEGVLNTILLIVN